MPPRREAGQPLHPIYPQGDHYLRLLRGNVFRNPATMMFRRSALESVGGFSTAFKATEDYQLCLWLTRRFAAVGHDEVVADYRQHLLGMSRQPSLMSDSLRGVLEAQRAQVSGNRAYEWALKAGLRRWRRRYYADVLVARARENARNRRWGLVVRDALSLIRANPRMLIEDAGRFVKVRLRNGRGTVAD